MRQQPARQRRRRGLAVRAGDDDRPRAPEEVLADRLGQRAVADLAIEHLLELGVAARDGVADDDEVEVGGDVLGAVAVEASGCPRARGSRSSAGRRSGPSRCTSWPRSSAAPPASPSPCRRCRSGESRRQSAATAGLFDDRAARESPAPTTRARTPNGSVSAGPSEWPDGKPKHDRPGKVGEQRPRASPRAVGVAARLVAAAELAEHDRRRTRRARRSAAAASASGRAGTAARATSSRTARAPAADRTRTACRATPASCVSVPPSSRPARLAGRDRLEPAARRARPAARRGQRRAGTSRDRSRRAARQAGPRASARGTTTMPQLAAVRNVSSDVLSL